MLEEEQRLKREFKTAGVVKVVDSEDEEEDNFLKKVEDSDDEIPDDLLNLKLDKVFSTAQRR